MVDRRPAQAPVVIRRGLALLLLGLAAACGSPAASTTPLTLTVLPPEEPVEPRTAIAGQHSIFLVQVAGGPTDQPIEVEATADGEATVGVAPDEIDEATIAEITVTPEAVTSETTIRVEVTARRGDTERTEVRSLPVWVQTDTLEAEARGRLAAFTGWLAAERPDLGITETTEWTPSALQTRMLVVSHYLFLSDDWEAVLEWHVMIAPHDWERLILRRRWIEDRPSLAYEIASVTAGDVPREIAPPDAVIR